MPSYDALFSRFPKQRFRLPAEQQAIYEQEYLMNREGQTLMSSLSQKLEGWMHKQVAMRVTGNKFLELGAGTLNQVPYMQQKAISCCDVVEPATFLYEHSPYKQSIHHFYNDISECNGAYDSIFSIATLEHVIALPQLLAKTALLLTDHGRVINAIPCEGGALWGISWRLSTGIAYKLRTGFSYANIMKHEHVNDHDEIIALHRYFFEYVHVSYFPLPNKHMAFYACIIAEKPFKKINQEFLGYLE